MFDVSVEMLIRLNVADAYYDDDLVLVVVVGDYDNIVVVVDDDPHEVELVVYCYHVLVVHEIKHNHLVQHCDYFFFLVFGALNLKKTISPSCSAHEGVKSVNRLHTPDYPILSSCPTPFS